MICRGGWYQTHHFLTCSTVTLWGLNEIKPWWELTPCWHNGEPELLPEEFTDERGKRGDQIQQGGQGMGGGVEDGAPTSPAPVWCLAWMTSWHPPTMKPHISSCANSHAAKVKTSPTLWLIMLISCYEDTDLKSTEWFRKTVWWLHAHQYLSMLKSIVCPDSWPLMS